MSEVRILSPRPRPRRPQSMRAVRPRNEEDRFMALALISRPSKTAMQSGRRQTRKWLLEFEPATRRDPAPVVGGSSARDTLNEVQLHFDTLDEAVAFADKHGLQYTIIEPHQRRPKAKSYADNFRYDRARRSCGGVEAIAASTARCDKASASAHTDPVAQLDRALAF